MSVPFDFEPEFPEILVEWNVPLMLTLFIQITYCTLLGTNQHMAQFHLSIYKPHTTCNSSIRCDEGLTPETSALEFLYGGQFTLSIQLLKPNYPIDGMFLICNILLRALIACISKRKREKCVRPLSNG